MKKQARVLVTGAAVLSLVIGLLAVGSGGAADDKSDLRATIQKIADALEKKDFAQAKKLAEEVAKTNVDLEEVMHLMSKRDPGGKAKVFGVGKKPGTIQPDGIEAKVQNMGKKALPQTQIDKEAADLAESSHESTSRYRCVIVVGVSRGGGVSGEDEPPERATVHA